MLVATAEVKKLLALCIADGMLSVCSMEWGREGFSLTRKGRNVFFFFLFFELSTLSRVRKRYVRIEIAEISRNFVRGETVPGLFSVSEQKSWTGLA